MGRQGQFENEIRSRFEALERQLTERLDGAAADTRSLVAAQVGEITARLEEGPGDRVGFLLNTVAQEVRTDLEKLLQEARRLDELTRHVFAMTEDLEAALKDLHDRAAGDGARHERVEVKLNQVYRADMTGYVSAFFVGGYTDKLELLVGPEDPPTSCICALNTTNDLNSYAGGIVRPGEYWMAKSKRGDKSGVKCVFTPVF
jgi:hypothetical protein